MNISDGWILFPAGSFIMGNPECDNVPHRVTISKKFVVKRTLVTQSEWMKVMRNNPSYFSNLNPDTTSVDQVSWFDAVAYCNALSIQEGLEPCYTICQSAGTPGERGFSAQHVKWNKEIHSYRLLTEAEWEYAHSMRMRVNIIKGVLQEDIPQEEVDWWGDNTIYKRHPKNKKPDEECIVPIHNCKVALWEWVWDGYEKYTPDSVIDPSGPDEPIPMKIIRGHTFLFPEEEIRSQSRYSAFSDDRFFDFGFRVCRNI